jgi:hypothetical protein
VENSENPPKHKNSPSSIKLFKLNWSLKILFMKIRKCMQKRQNALPLTEKKWVRAKFHSKTEVSSLSMQNEKHIFVGVLKRVYSQIECQLCMHISLYVDLLMLTFIASTERNKIAFEWCSNHVAEGQGL